MYVTAIIAAGGRGRRFGGDAAEAAADDRRPRRLERSVAAFATHPRSTRWSSRCRRPGRRSAGVSRDAGEAELRVVAGGARRQDSVANAFRAANADADIVVIHDAARPFVTAAADLPDDRGRGGVRRGAGRRSGARHREARRAGSGCRSAQPALRHETLPRDAIFLAQTPQAFRRDVLADALALGDAGDATDEAALAERAGHPVRLVEGEPSNIKITTPEDLAMAEASRALDGVPAPRRGARSAPATTCIGSSTGAR